MIIRDKSLSKLFRQDDISAIAEGENIGFEQYGSEFKITHVQPIADIVNEVQAFKSLDTRNGFSFDKSVRRIASIPAIEFVKHPEWAHDQKALRKWLKSEEGRMYLTVEKGV